MEPTNAAEFAAYLTDTVDAGTIATSGKDQETGVAHGPWGILHAADRLVAAMRDGKVAIVDTGGLPPITFAEGCDSDALEFILGRLVGCAVAVVTNAGTRVEGHLLYAGGDHVIVGDSTVARSGSMLDFDQIKEIQYL